MPSFKDIINIFGFPILTTILLGNLISTVMESILVPYMMSLQCIKKCTWEITDFQGDKITVYMGPLLVKFTLLVLTIGFAMILLPYQAS